MTGLHSKESIAELDAAVRILVDGGLVGKIRHHADALAIALLGAELGLPPATSLRTIWITANGEPVMYADALLAVVVRGGGRVVMIDGTTSRVVLEGRREARRLRVSLELIEELRKDLPSAIATNYPYGWLRGRAIGILARELFPDLCLRMYVPEELDLSDRFVRLKIQDMAPRPLEPFVAKVPPPAPPAPEGPPQAPTKEAPTSLAPDEDEPAVGDAPPEKPHPISAAMTKLAPAHVLSHDEEDLIRSLEEAFARVDLLEELDAICRGKTDAIAKMTEAGRRQAFVRFTVHQDRVRAADLLARELADQRVVDEVNDRENGS